MNKKKKISHGMWWPNLEFEYQNNEFLTN
jgi:hypothetical protein